MDKINIYVPEDIQRKLDGDAQSFEVFKKDGHQINRNKFLNALVQGYYDSYTAENARIRAGISKALADSGLTAAKQEQAADNILHQEFYPALTSQASRSSKRLSLRPVANSESRIRLILHDIGKGDSISSYFLRMLTSYCTRPSYERERIIFSETYKVLQEACSTRRAVTFTMSTDRESVQKVIPFKIAVGQGEQFNYLLCYKHGDMQEAWTYRLNRIVSPCCGEPGTTIPASVLRRLKLMSQNGAQYAINDDEETRVLMNSQGVHAYQSIYFGRPPYTRIEERPEGLIYHFNCSANQLFLYFKKFDPGEAKVLSPDSLRQQLVAFFEGNLRMYSS